MRCVCQTDEDSRILSLCGLHSEYMKRNQQEFTRHELSEIRTEFQEVSNNYAKETRIVRNENKRLRDILENYLSLEIFDGE